MSKVGDTGKRFRLAVLNTHPIQYFAPLYRRIAESPDIDIMVFYCSRQGLERGFVDPGFAKEVVWDIPLLEGYRYQFLPNIGGDRGVGNFFDLINPSIVLELWKQRYDAILVHGHSYATTLMALGAALVNGTRVFMRSDTHLSLRKGKLKRLLRPVVMRAVYGLCSGCLYNGTRNREFYESLGVPDSKLFFVPFTVDNAYFRQAAEAATSGQDRMRDRLGLPRKLPIILYASKLIPRKRPRDLLLAHADLARRGIRAALVFVGDGELRASLEEEVASQGLSSVVFAGFVNQSELPAYYAMADVFVLPSEDEPWGLVINEVMACGVPVITTTEVGAAADLVLDGRTGFTFQAGAISVLADALARVVTDDTLRRTMSEKCLARIGQWSYGEAIEGIRRALSGG